MNQTAQQSTAQQPTDFLLRISEVKRIVGLSSATIYRLIRAGKFPNRVAIGTGSVRWKQSEIVAWQANLTTA